jgi:hypothetical protein
MNNYVIEVTVTISTRQVEPGRPSQGTAPGATSVNDELDVHAGKAIAAVSVRSRRSNHTRLEATDSAPLLRIAGCNDVRSSVGVGRGIPGRLGRDVGRRVRLDIEGPVKGRPVQRHSHRTVRELVRAHGVGAVDADGIRDAKTASIRPRVQLRTATGGDEVARRRGNSLTRIRKEFDVVVIGARAGNGNLVRGHCDVVADNRRSPVHRAAGRVHVRAGVVRRGIASAKSAIPARTTHRRRERHASSDARGRQGAESNQPRATQPARRTYGNGHGREGVRA